MKGIVATFTINAGMNEAFETLLSDFVNTVKASEPGTIVYQLFRDAKDGNTYHMMEQYADAAALDAHGKTAHIAALLPKIGPFLAGAPKLTHMDAVH
jgi:quinol monooxygenase YgiN